MYGNVPYTYIQCAHEYIAVNQRWRPLWCLANNTTNLILDNIERKPNIKGLHNFEIGSLRPEVGKKPLHVVSFNEYQEEVKGKY